MIELKGKRVFLTGASRGIGQQIAYGFAGLGANLILQARKKENLSETVNELDIYNVDVEIVEAELSDPESVASMLAEVDGLNKQVDIVYCCAAISGGFEDIFNSEREVWDRILEVNLHSTVKINEHFLPKLIEQGFGRVINVSSGIQDQPNLGAYSVSKAGVERFTRDLSKQMKEKNVLMNCIDPGWIKTDMGGPNAFSEVDSVLPGMLVPALLNNDGPVSQLFSAQEFTGLDHESLVKKVDELKV